MKKIILPILCLLAGILLGGAWSIRQINAAGSDPSMILQNGAWRCFPSMDLAANKIQRAYIGKIGLLALRESEVIYFLAARDSEGNPLSSKHEYQLSGKNLNARYWSFTLYDGDHFLIPNEEDVFSINMDNVIYRDSTRSSYDIFISKNPKPQNWIPTGDGENMSILLRMYNPDESVYNNKTTTPLPELIKIK